MNKTGIEYIDYTWNPITGCYHGCEYCYGRRLCEKRFPDMYPNGFEYTFWEDRLDEPMGAKPSSILVSSMGDCFGDWVPLDDIKRVLEVAAKWSQHDFVFLTKNPSRYDEIMSRIFVKGSLPTNFWLGTSVESSDKIGRLKELPQYMKQIISLEPLLGPIRFSAGDAVNLNWIIVGAKTGPNSKQPKRKWVEQIIKFGDTHEIPVFLKDNLNFSVPVRNFPETYKKPRSI